MTSIKNRVRDYRQLGGLTLEQLADLSDLSMSQLSKIETFEPGWSIIQNSVDLLFEVAEASFHVISPWVLALIKKRSDANIKRPSN
jgi:transcriptional regulator with XRE-family HTH domain